MKHPAESEHGGSGEQSEAEPEEWKSSKYGFYRVWRSRWRNRLRSLALRRYLLLLRALLHSNLWLFPGLQHGTPFLFTLLRFSLSLRFSFFMALLVPPFLRLPELFHLSRLHLPLGSFESFLLGGKLSLSSFGFGLRSALLINLRRKLPLQF